MKHPKDRGDRLRKNRNAQHRALFQSGLFRQKVEQDKRKKIIEQVELEEDLYETNE